MTGSSDTLADKAVDVDTMARGFCLTLEGSLPVSLWLRRMSPHEKDRRLCLSEEHQKSTAALCGWPIRGVSDSPRFWVC
jgi:hypothetical protein